VSAATDVVLVTPLADAALAELTAAVGQGPRLHVVRDAAGLAATPIGAQSVLICYGTGVIVPPETLRKLGRPAYNFHAASPDYPGRDPHHFAIYDGARRYGATAHRMSERVDAGPIVGVELFDVPEACTPLDLLARANDAALALFRRLVPAIVAGHDPPALADVRWGSRKTSRKDFAAMCRLPATISSEEFARRFRAFDGGAYDNLTTVLHGRTFRIDKSVPPQPPDGTDWSEFTEAGYAALLRLALDAGYRFAGYRDRGAGRHVLWRHDIDFSVHRSRRLAEIESGLGVRATYFVNPHCAYYNALEPEVLALLRQIAGLGHAIGLHFDADAYPQGGWTLEALEARLDSERRVLADMLGMPVEAVSFHNPDVGSLLSFDQDELAGMVNAYSRRLREGYVYASDSNGYWRYKSAAAVIRQGHDRLHILTHPEWYTPEPLSPRARIERCAAGRAAAVMRRYDEILARYGRRNIGASSDSPVDDA
jgi:hypothetical protein